MRTLLRYILACARSFLVAIFTGAVITVFANSRKQVPPTGR